MLSVYVKTNNVWTWTKNYSSEWKWVHFVLLVGQTNEQQSKAKLDTNSVLSKVPVLVVAVVVILVRITIKWVVVLVGKLITIKL